MAAQGVRVFVGNLAFKTTDQNLHDLFGKVGQILNAGIVTRGRRSLGYGFVEFATLEQAQAALALNDTTLLERQIKVELAKEPSERPPRPPREPREPREPRQHAGGEGEGDGEGGLTPERRRRPPRRRRGPKAAGGVDGALGDAPQPSGEPSPAQPRAPRPPRPPRQERPKVESETTVFVANLPFSVDDAALAKIFEVQRPKSAHVVRTRTGRSRGYGFVEFNTKAEQQSAITKVNGLQVDAPNGVREISVTVSNSSPVELGENQ